MRKKIWQHVPPRPSSSTKDYKAQVLDQATRFLDSELKADNIHPQPVPTDRNYIVDIFAKWHGRRLYFCSKYASPSTNAISPFFDSPFARLDYVSEDCFHLSYNRYTGEWIQLYSNLSLSESLAKILGHPLLRPSPPSA